MGCMLAYPSPPAVVRSTAFARIEAMALTALSRELACPFKPGLVSLRDSGSHADMDAGTFIASIRSLRGYFADIAEAGADGAAFAELAALGRAAEARMLVATGGRNTHRGAIFALGLLSAAAGRLSRIGPERSARTLCGYVAQRWGRAVLAAGAERHDTHGEKVRRRYCVPGAREQAALGFPTVLEHGLPALHACLHAQVSLKRACLQTLYAITAVLDDSNLLYRGGEKGLAFARREARQFLARGGMLQPDAWKQADDLHHRFVERRLSPGGAADLLAVTLFVAAWEKMGAGRCA